MSDPLGHGAERLQAMEAATADDEQVGIGCGGDERGDRVVRQLLAVSADDLADAPPIDRLAAVSHDRPQLGIEALCDLTRRGVGGGRLWRAIDPDDDLVRGTSPARVRPRAISTEEGALWITSLAVEPMTKPIKRPCP